MPLNITFNMGKKLTIQEKDERVVQKVLNRIKSIEKIYGILLTRRGCFRYYNKRGNELRLKREIKDREKELNDLKNKSKGN